MEAIKKVLAALLQKEYELLMAYLNPDLSEEEYQAIFKEYAAYFHNSLEAYLQPYKVRDEGLLAYPDDLELYRNNFQKRTVFQIAHYSSPTLGKELAANLEVKELYVADLNNNQISGRPTLSYNDRYALAKVGEGFQVIYRELFMAGKWEKPHAYEPAWVVDYGQLEGVEKIIAPVEEQSLDWYNKI